MLLMRFLACLFMLCGISSLHAQEAERKRIQSRFILAEDGETIELGEGRFFIDATLSMEGKKHITIRGKGIDKTILSFKGQRSGAEGIRISNCSNITLEDFSAEDAKGDIIKTMHVNGVTFRRVRAAWTGKPSKHNGSYALYPVSCEKVLVESCVARGASDAGIYVGQSRTIIVRHNKAFENVAGIEIENSIDADVYGNEAYHNTGGILVFDLPDLEVKKGGNCRVFDNKVWENNTANFAPKGNIVGRVPQGTGIILLAANNVEIFRNQVTNNRTVGVSIVSYFISENPILDSAYYPYPTAIHIHDNQFSRKKQRATGKGRMGKLYRFKLRFGKNVPDIVYDGILDAALVNSSGAYPDEKRICLRNNTGAGFANIDAANNFKRISRDAGTCDCSLPALPAVNPWF